MIYILLLKCPLVLTLRHHLVSPILNNIFVCISLLDLYSCVIEQELIGSLFSINSLSVKIMFVYSYMRTSNQWKETQNCIWIRIVTCLDFLFTKTVPQLFFACTFLVIYDLVKSRHIGHELPVQAMLHICLHPMPPMMEHMPFLHFVAKHSKLSFLLLLIFISEESEERYIMFSDGSKIESNTWFQYGFPTVY